MVPYHKIDSVFKRDGRGQFTDEFSRDEFGYLRNNLWLFEEKVDGTNIRVHFDGEDVKFGGRTDRAQLPATLLGVLVDMFPAQKFEDTFRPTEGLTFPSVTLYGEGYGAKIQKGGGNYIPDGQSFVLFDVKVGGLFLTRENVRDVARRMGIKHCPQVGQGTLAEGIDFVRNGMKSTWGDFEAEGIILRPLVEMRDRRGDRIITKLKVKDFR